MKPLELWALVAGVLTAAWSLPLLRIVRSWHGTSLSHASAWLLLAWSGWALLPWGLLVGVPAWPAGYVAVILSSCAFVAVLGARLPGMAAWNFVVAGLLVVLMLPLLEQSWSSPGWHLDEIRTLFLTIILAVGLLSYLPTRHGLSALLAGSSCGMLIFFLHFGATSGERPGLALQAQAGTLAAAWLAWAWGHKPPFGTAKALWFAFRDRYGAVWALRVIEQFNHAAKHAGWRVGLGWTGFFPHAEGTKTPPEDQLHERLRQLLAKFMPAE